MWSMKQALTANHTPGPWLLIDNTVYALMDNPRPSRGMPEQVNRFDCTVQGWHCPPDEKCANARLIASAPDLLRVAKAAFRYLSADSPAGEAVLKDLLAVIEQAEGE